MCLRKKESLRISSGLHKQIKASIGIKVMEKEYFAFISYQRKDEDWAKWLADQLEHYHLPLTLNGRDDLPKDLRPIFRDIDELAAGNLPQQIHRALINSKNLIVVCSPNAAKSPWVNKEVETFIGLGKLESIFPFIIDGVAFSKNEDEECLPAALLKLSEDKERLGVNIREYKDGPKRLCKDCPLPKDDRDKNQGNINDKGRDAAVVKIIAGMLGLGFDTLWQRYEREKTEEERKIREQRDNLLRVQSRLVAEKALSIAEEDSYLARKLAVEVLPKDLKHPDRPYTLEAERALREACKYESAILSGHTSCVRFASYSPDGSEIVSAFSDGAIRIWDSYTGECKRELSGHTYGAKSAVYSPDGSEIVSVSGDGTVRIWNSHTGECKLMLSGLTYGAKSAAYSPDGSEIVSASLDGTIRTWDSCTGECKRLLSGYTNGAQSAVFSPDGREIVYGLADGKVRIWDTHTSECKRLLPGNMGGMKTVTYNLDGGNIVSVSADGIVYIVNTQTSGWKRVLSGNTDESVTYNLDGRNIVSVSADGTVRIWNSCTGECKRVLSAHNVREIPMAYNPDGSEIVTVSFGRTICIRDSRSVECKRVLSAHNVRVNSVSYSPEGSEIVSVSNDRTIRIWDSRSGECKRVLYGHTERVNSAVYSPDGSKIVSASLDKMIIVWDAKDSREVYSWEFPSECEFATFSPDGCTISVACSDGNIYLIDFPPLQELIDQTRERFKNNPLTIEERQKYYLE